MPAIGVSPLHQLPPPPAAFTGREGELADFEQQLTSAQATGATISASTAGHAGLQGMGGVGKTALAIVLAHRLKGRYPDAQFFLNLRGADPDHRPPVPPADAMQSVIHAFHPEARLPDTVEALAPIYRSVLTEAGRVLLVLDNAADAEQVRPLLPPANCLLLVTSRAQFTLPGLATRNLDCLPPNKSQELLLKLAERAKGHAQEAAELCGHLPLALEVFAGAVNDKSLTPVPELVDRLRARRDKLVPVEAAFEVSYEQLAEELRLRWRQLAVFPTSFDLRAAAAVWGEGLEAGRDAMQALVNASLVEWDPGKGRFRLHDLVRQFCDDQLSDSERAGAGFVHAAYYRNVGVEADALCLQGGENVVRGLELFDRERAHLEGAFERLQAQSDRESAALTVSLVNAVVYTGSLRFHPRQRIRWSDAQRDAARVLGDRRGEGVALGNLGNAYADSSEARKAIQCYEQALVIAHELGDRRAEGNALGNLGMCYADLGEVRKAVEFYDQALVIAQEIGDRLGGGNVLSALGSAYAALGDMRKALALYDHRLGVARELGDRRGEGAALGNLGIAYSLLGDTRKAIEFYEQALAIAHELGDRSAEGAGLGNLGIAYHLLGDARKAIEFHEQALVIARELGDRRGEGKALGGLGNSYVDLGQMREAIGFYEQALAITREIGDRRAEAIALWNSALVLARLNNRAQALVRGEGALRILQAIEEPSAAKLSAHLAQWRVQSSS